MNIPNGLLARFWRIVAQNGVRQNILPLVFWRIGARGKKRALSAHFGARANSCGKTRPGVANRDLAQFGKRDSTEGEMQGVKREQWTSQEQPTDPDQAAQEAAAIRRHEILAMIDRAWDRMMRTIPPGPERIDRDAGRSGD